MSAEGLCLVQKQSPATVLDSVSATEFALLRDYFLVNREAPALTRFLERQHETGRWVICDCLGPEVPLIERPAMTVARSPKDKLYPRNLISRRAHAEHCPFRYEPGKRSEDEPSEPAAPQDIREGPLDLHRAPAQGTVTDGPDGDKGPGKRKRKAPYPRLGQVLLHLMGQAGMLDQRARFNLLDGIKSLDEAAAGLQAFAGTPLDEVLALSARQEEELVRKVQDLRQRVANAYGVMVVIVHEVETKPLTLVRRDRRGAEWRCRPHGEVTVWSRRSINKGPFIAAITYAPPAGGGEVQPQHAFVLPILSKTRPLPVESELERQVAGSLMRLIEWAAKARQMPLTLTKPMHDIAVPGGECRPDFLVEGPGGQAIVEVMGMLDDADYRERKARTVPLMREIAEVIEIGELPTAEEARKEALHGMNKCVLREVGPRRGHRSRAQVPGK